MLRRYCSDGPHLRARARTGRTPRGRLAERQAEVDQGVEGRRCGALALPALSTQGPKQGGELAASGAVTVGEVIGGRRHNRDIGSKCASGSAVFSPFPGQFRPG